MKFNRFMIACILFLAILTIGTASAADEIMYSTEDVLAIDSGDELEMTQDLSADLSGSVEDDNSLSSGNSTEITPEANINSMTDLQNAINSASAGDTIVLDADIEQDTASYVMINKALIIDGDGHSIDMKGISYAFRVHNAHATLMNMIILNGQSADFAGAVYATSSCSCTIINCTFINNNAGRHGGALFLNGDQDSDIEGCTFINNTADENGGAIYAKTSINIDNCIFRDNAAECGGAVYCSSGESCITNSAFSGNSGRHGASAYIQNGCISNCDFSNNVVDDAGTDGARGGALYINGESTISNSTFSGNRAKTNKGYGGAIYVKQNSEIINCEFSNNAAGTSGGAVYAYTNASCILTDCRFTANEADIAENTYGGAFFADAFSTLNNCIFTENSALNTGGAIYIAKNGCNLTDCKFTNNNAGTSAGAVFSQRDYACDLKNCEFEGNTAGTGGAFYGHGSLYNCSFTGNHAIAFNGSGSPIGDGGAVFSFNNPNIINCIFTRNTANRDGGAILSKQKGNAEDCIFINNTAGRYGGSIYQCNANGCDIIDSTAKNGAGIYKGDATECFIANCTTINSGSAIYDGNAYDSTIINCYNSKAIVFNGTVENCIIAESPQLYCPDISVYPGETAAVPIRILDQDGNDVDGLTVNVEVYQNGAMTDSFTTTSGTTLALDVNQPLILALTSKCLKPLNTSITFAKPSPFISAPAVTTKYGKDVNITVYLESDVSGNVWITINKVKQKTAVKNGVATYTVSGLNYGLYPVEISYNGNYKYRADTISTTLKVNKNSPITSVVANNVLYGNDATVRVNVAQNVPGNIKITVNGVTVKAPVTNGVATATFTSLKAKTYEVTANYAGNVNYVAQTKTTSLTVTKGTPIISIDAPDTSFSTPATITVNLKNDVPGNVRVTINGVTEKAPITNGIVTYTVSGLKVGAHAFSVSYAGNANYNAQTVTATLTIVKAAPIKSVSVENINVGDTAVVVVKMADNVNGNVKITVNGVSEKVKIVNGIATLNVTGLKAGTYDVSAYYAGNANFEAQTSTASVTVTKSSPGLSMTVATKSGKTTVTANIASDAPGNVKVIVDGATTYTAKITNGVATYTINGLTSGTHTIKVTYGGNYKYTAQSRTKTITV